MINVDIMDIREEIDVFREIAAIWRLSICGLGEGFDSPKAYGYLCTQLEEQADKIDNMLKKSLEGKA